MTSTSVSLVPTTTTTTAITIAPVDLPSLLIADAEGIRVVDDAKVVERFLEGEEVALAVPDLMGGVVFQGPSHEITGSHWDDGAGRLVFEWADGGPDPVWWIPGPGREPVELITHTDARLTLVDVVMIDDVPQVLHRLYIGGDIDESSWDMVLEWLCLYDLTTGTTEVLGLVGSYESSHTQMRIGGNVVAVTFDPYGDPPGTMVGAIPRAVLGTEVEYDWLPTLALDHLDYGPGVVCRESFMCDGWALATAASDGSRFSWVQGGRHWSDGGDAVVWPLEVVSVDPATGAEARRADLGFHSSARAEEGERAAFIDDDGRYVVVSGVGPNNEVVLVGPNAEVVSLTLPNATVSLWETAP